MKFFKIGITMRMLEGALHCAFKKPLPQLQSNSETKYKQECQITVCFHGNTFAKDPSVAVDRETDFFPRQNEFKGPSLW